MKSKDQSGGRWTQERRVKQAEAIRFWKPWANSTGPKTAGGKEKAARNAFKGGAWRELKDMARTIREHEGLLRIAREVAQKRNEKSEAKK